MADADIDYLEQWVLLAIRRLQPNANAASIQAEIKKQTGRKPYNIYIPLYALRKKGLIKNSPPRELTTTGRVRKQPIVVHLTEQGRHTLEEWLRAIDALRRGPKKEGAAKTTQDHAERVAVSPASIRRSRTRQILTGIISLAAMS